MNAVPEREIPFSVETVAADASAAPHAYPAARVAWTTVAVLSTLYLLSLLDRLVISLLVGPIRHDLGITDFQVSLLQGFAFGVFYALCGLPVGWLVDRVSRRWIVFWGVAIWTLSTAACGLARNFPTLMLARIGVGAGETTLSPSTYSMLADSFPPQRLNLAMSMFTMGSLVGTCLAFTLGGAVVQLVSAHQSVMLPLVGEVRSWQFVFMLVGLPGIVLSFAVFLFPEPRRLSPAVPVRTRSFAADAGGLGHFVRRRARFLVCHHAGTTLAIAAITGLVLWAPAYLGRAFGWKPGEIGLWLGGVNLVAGVSGAVMHGRVCDRLFSRGVKDAQLRWFGLCALVAAPIGVAGLLMHTPAAFLAAFFAVNLLVGPGMATAAAALQIVTPPALRGRISSIYLFLLILLGIGAGPSVVAACTDFLFHDDARLGDSLALVMGVCLPLAAALLLGGMRAMREAVH